MPVVRTAIEKALDELKSYEDGMRFQGLAVVLGKQRWPELIACERKKDLGLDAYASASLSAGKTGLGLASSITTDIKKVSADAETAKKNFPDLTTLVFVTSGKVSNVMKNAWAKAILDDHGLELHVISREDIIATLTLPENASLCGSLLYIDVPTEAPTTDLVARVRQAAADVAQNWAGRLKGQPVIDLNAARLERDSADSGEVFSLSDIDKALSESRRIVLEAPAGRGKTTTLIQLAQQARAGRTALMVDLPTWVASRRSVLDYLAGMLSFQARGITAVDLARAQASESLSFLLNGWNEITESNAAHATDALRDLERDFPRAGIIVATRTHHLTPLPGALRLRLLALTRRQRASYLAARLGDKGPRLQARLDAEPVLDELTRTPFILSEVTALFEAGAAIPNTKIGVIAGVIRLQEEGEHRNQLQADPLHGRAADYLEALATEMTRRGGVSLSDADARAIAVEVATDLARRHQITAIPQPTSVLAALTAHHVLERTDYPNVSYRFGHQQFQEHYAAVGVRAQLLKIADADTDAQRRFAAAYVNEPAWEEPLRMIAETLNTPPDDPAHRETTRAGRIVVEMALGVDPIFTAELARLCGRELWRSVGAAVGRRLRTLHALRDGNYRDCALAAMLASGSEDFKDVLLPLLSSSDNQVRLNTYRLWPDIALTSLGPDWRKEVRAWPEDVRADFIGEMLHHRFDADLTSFAAADESAKVKKAAVSGLSWRGSEEGLKQVLESMDAETFDEVARGSAGERFPDALQPRVLDALRRFYDSSSDQPARLRTLIHMAELGEADIDGRLKECLSAVPRAEMHNLGHYYIQPALDILRQRDPEWVSGWVATQLVERALWQQDYWMAYVPRLPGSFLEHHLERVETEHVQYRNLEGLAALLAVHGDANLAARIFSKIRELRVAIEADTTVRHEAEWEIERQLDTLFRALPGDVAAAGMLSVVADPPQAPDVKIAGKLVSRALRHNERSFDVGDDALKERLRAYLKAGVTVALSDAGFGGEQRGNLAAAIAEVGKPDDMPDVLTLVRADVERRRATRDAMSYTNYYVPAIVQLDPERSERVLIELLSEPEYAVQTAEEMAKPFLVKSPRVFDRNLQYEHMWAAREGRLAPPADNERRIRFAAALRNQLARLMEEQSRSKEPGTIPYRLKELAKALAAVDGRDSSGLVFDVVALGGEWDDWRRVETIERLLLAGVVPPTDKTFEVVDAAVERVRKYGRQNGNDWVLKRALCLCAFTDDPVKGIQKIRDVVAATKLAPYELRDLVAPLGESRCDAAVGLLRDLASAPGAFKEFADVWPGALAKLGTPAAHDLLLSLVDPDTRGLPIEARINREDALVWHIAELAKADPKIDARLRELCSRDLPELNRQLLAKAMGYIGTPEALMASLDLIDDRSPSPIPQGTWEHVEAAFVKRRPYGRNENVFTLETTASNEVRATLFDMALHDERRRKSAFTLLGQIEEWRLERGRPAGEPRHPAFQSGAPWPPKEESA